MNTYQLTSPEELTSAQLVAVHNYLSPKPVKKFRDKATAVKRAVEAVNDHGKDEQEFMIKSMNDDLRGLFTVAKVDPEIDKRFAKLTAKEKSVLAAIYRIGGRDSARLVDLRVHTDAAEAVLKRILLKLQSGKLIQIANGKVTLFASTVDFVVSQDDLEIDRLSIDPEAVAPVAVDLKKPDWNHPGPRSDFSGKRITRVSETNPRREGTLGWQSFELIVDDMTFEDYKAKGGRNNDLRWDLDHGYIKLKD